METPETVARAQIHGLLPEKVTRTETKTTCLAASVARKLGKTLSMCTESWQGAHLKSSENMLHFGKVDVSVIALKDADGSLSAVSNRAQGKILSVTHGQPTLVDHDPKVIQGIPFGR